MNSVDRRSLLRAALGAAGSASVAACGGQHTAALRAAGRTTHRFVFTAAPTVLDLGAGVTARTWTYLSGGLAPEVRVTAGDTVHADLVNRLPDGATTSVHWHGVAIRNDMDGAPPVTQRPVAPGETFSYRFVAPNPGTHFFHSHVGLQLDRGMYGPLIVEDPRESLPYDDEWVVVLDDWLDGVTGTPDEAFAALGTGTGTGMGGMGMGMRTRLASRGGTSPLLGGNAGDVDYPLHLVNGRVPEACDRHTARPGSRVRLRIINAGADTAYRVALGGHRMTITHTDGFPVEHLTADALLIGMGERYDALVTLGDGVFPLVALAEGRDATAFALVRTGTGAAPPATVRPQELYGRVATAARLRAAEEVRLPSRAPDLTYRIRLTGSMRRYDWSINRRRFDMDHPMAHPYLVGRGDRVRLEFVNASGMWHPMHLHGHAYQLGDAGPRKDTAIVRPGQRLSVDFDADNPGDWMMHCHNAYHGEAGMMALLAYRD